MEENRKEETGQMGNKLAEMPVGKLLRSLAMPAIAAQIVNLLYNMVDRIYIGHIEGVGALALTGLGVTLPRSWTLTSRSLDRVTWEYCPWVRREK